MQTFEIFRNVHVVLFVFSTEITNGLCFLSQVVVLIISLMSNKSVINVLIFTIACELNILILSAQTASGMMPAHMSHKCSYTNKVAKIIKLVHCLY